MPGNHRPTLVAAGGDSVYSEAEAHLKAMQHAMDAIAGDVDALPDFCLVSRPTSDSAAFRHVGVHLMHGIIVEAVATDRGRPAWPRFTSTSTPASLPTLPASAPRPFTSPSLRSTSQSLSPLHTQPSYAPLMHRLLHASAAAHHASAAAVPASAAALTALNAAPRDTLWRVLAHAADLLAAASHGAPAPRLPDQAAACFHRIADKSRLAAMFASRSLSALRAQATHFLLQTRTLTTILALEATRVGRSTSQSVTGDVVSSGLIRLTHISDFKRAGAARPGPPTPPTAAAPAPAPTHDVTAHKPAVPAPQRREVLLRAQRALGPFEYSLSFCNCQHVAAHILGRAVATPNQAQAVGGLLAGLTGAAGLSAAAVATGAACATVPATFLGSQALGAMLGLTTTVVLPGVVLPAMLLGAAGAAVATARACRKGEGEHLREVAAREAPVYGSEQEQVIMERLVAESEAWDERGVVPKKWE